MKQEKKDFVRLACLHFLNLSTMFSSDEIQRLLSIACDGLWSYTAVHTWFRNQLPVGPVWKHLEFEVYLACTSVVAIVMWTHAQSMLIALPCINTCHHISNKLSFEKSLVIWHLMMIAIPTSMAADGFRVQQINTHMASCWLSCVSWCGL